MEKRHVRPAWVIAFCALMAALGAVLMTAGGLIPVLTYCSPLLAGLFLIPVTMEFGAGRAWMTWGVTALLAMILSADKEAAFFYLFLGWYPILKPRLDRIPVRAARAAAKLVLFAAALALMYGLLYFVLRLDTVVEELGGESLAVNLAYIAMTTAVMMIFDSAVGSFTVLYLRRLRPKLRFLS